MNSNFLSIEIFYNKKENKFEIRENGLQFSRDKNILEY
jgi:hypothetical protein